MTYEQLVEQYAKQHGVTKKTAREDFDRTFGVVQEELRKSGEVKVPGFGRFVVRRRPARKAKVPDGRGGVEERELPASWRVAFSPAKNLKGTEAH